jgi:UDP-N-acetylglucosamine:LPS N-acetylglucosamine transferase
MHRFDYLIHPGVGKPEGSENFPNWQGGPEWVLAHRSPAWCPSHGTPKITVTTGSQAFDFFRPWLEDELASLSEVGIEVSWVVGKHSENQIDSLNIAEGPISYVDDFRLNERFSSSNLVITRFGVTVFELTARGVPTIILPGWSDGEREEVSELERAGVALVARSNGEVATIAHNLAHDRSLQNKLSNLGKDYFKLEQSHPLSLLVSQLVEEQK